MIAEKKKMILDFLEGEIMRARLNAIKTDEASKFVVTGPSQSGDKYHAQNAASLAASYVARLENLKKEISEADIALAQIVKPGSHIEIEYADASRLDFYLVDNAVKVTRFLFVSERSPLGSAIMGKKVGDNFGYELENAGGRRSFS